MFEAANFVFVMIFAVILSRVMAGHVNYDDVDSDRYGIYSFLEITTATDHNHREQLNTGSFWILLVSSFLDLRLSTGHAHSLELTDSLTN